MKKYFRKFTLFFCALALGFVMAACSSIDEKSKAAELLNGEKPEKLLGITKNLCWQLLDGNVEAAYLRTEKSYQVVMSRDAFVALWNENADGLYSDCQVSFGADDMKSYCNVYGTFEPKDGGEKLYATFVYPKSGIMPVDVQFSKENPVEKSAELAGIYDGNLKDFCQDYFMLGCGLTGYSSSTLPISLPKYMDLVDKHFSSCTFTNMMKPSAVLNKTLSQKNWKAGINSPGFNFTTIDETLEWCMNHGVQVRGHTLVWHTQVPAWFFREGFEDNGAFVTREVMIERTDNYIHEYMDYVQTNYPGTVYCWDVVNECVDPSEGDPESPFRCRRNLNKDRNLWYDVIGPDYPEVAFRIARKYAAPGVSLIYNDFNTFDRTKRQYIFNLLKDLKEKGLVDGVGMQAYWDVRYPDLQSIVDTIKLWATLGIEVQITEWSTNAPDLTAVGFEQQAERYASVFRVLQKLDTQGGGEANITCVSFFGVMDGYPLYGNDTSTSRIWDKNYEPKPVFFSVYDTLQDFY
ncbi:MAG: endo-1,4-beta-xylanase [Treponema sp.]|nr:endo-1,4-beta-xylanase [Treponema sp.]